MNNLARWIVGPLAGPECRRALARGWLIVVRMLAAFAMLGTLLLALWVWWINQRIEPDYRPNYEIRIGLTVIEGMLVTIALLLSPALLAGSLSGEKERGTLSLLLSTSVSAREIVTGRIVGKLAQVGMILLAGVPAVVALATLGGISAARIGLFLLVPAAVSIGAGGLAVLLSTLSRRGRDALLSVYLVELFLMLTPLLVISGLTGSGLTWVAATNPYLVLDALITHHETGMVGLATAFWLILGASGTAAAAWRLRPSCLAPADSERVATRRGRRWYVPPVNESRPMVWKELFIERVGTLGKFGRWVGSLLVTLLIGGSAGLTALVVWGALRPGYSHWADWSREMLAIGVGGSSVWLGFLIEWAIGLRAAVSISSERERGTWDALMTSPMVGREIVLGKLWGSLYAIRALIAATFLAWALAALVDAVPLKFGWCCEVLVVGAFMAAVGVRTSLACQTATRAMALTIGFWLGAYVCVAVAAIILIAVALLLGNAFWMAVAQLGLAPVMNTFWAPLPWYVAWPLAKCGVYAVLTVLIVLDTRLRFDRLAGRMTEGKAARALEDMLYGLPEEPVLLAKADDPLGKIVESWPEQAAPTAVRQS